jgi:hypothetical protein
MSSRRNSVSTASHVIVAGVNIGETSRILEVHTKEHKYNRTQGLLEKSNLTIHAYEKGHKICWKEAKVLQIESKRKYKESAQLYLVAPPISQPSLHISPIWTPIIAAESVNYKCIQCRVCVKIIFSCWYHAKNLYL